MTQMLEASPYFLTDAGSGQVIYRGRPSQITNLGYYIASVLKIAVCIVIFAMLKSKWDLSYLFLLVPVLFIIWTMVRRTVETHFIQFAIDPDRITWKTGVFSTTTSTVEIFRIQNVTTHQGFIEKFFNVGTVFIETIDPTHAWINMFGTIQPEQLRQWLTHYVQINRTARGFREFTGY